MISILFISLAAISNAVMDSIENEHIHVTVFKKLKPEFWSKRRSWNKARRIFNYPLDAWHLSKSAMIIFMCAAIVTYNQMINVYADFFLLGAIWNVVFNLFYNKVFKC